MSNSNYIERLNFRYATKKFNPSKELNNEQIEDLKKAIQLSASSYGLQPYEILIIKDKKLRQKLKEVSYNQSQITDSSHLIVFCAKTQLDESYLDSFINNISETRNIPVEDLKGMRDAISGSVLQFDQITQQQWSEKQAYIALGNMLSAVAHFGYDACPMEGFENEKYNDILELDKKNLHATVIAPVGYRSEDDTLQHMEKVRKPQNELFTTI
jgi:nitroreductase